VWVERARATSEGPRASEGHGPRASLLRGGGGSGAARAAGRCGQAGAAR
jgi:hypothetical protein